VTDDDGQGEAVLETLDLLSKKWHPVIVQRLLAEAPLRFSELQERIDGISAKVLTDSLDDLVENGLVDRTVISESPRHVEYELTTDGEQLESVLRALADWGERHLGSPVQPTVLIVDDDPRVSRMHASWLSDTYDVRQAHDGTRGLRLLDDEVDVVLLDRRMHGLSGREVLEAIRDRELTCGVVMVTAVDPDFDIVDMGFDDYLLKPVKRARLEETVAETMESLGEREAVREYRSVASKVAALRVEMNPAELEGNDEYERLLDRLRELESEVDAEGVETGVDI